MYHEDYREDAALQAASDGVRPFATAPSTGVPVLRQLGPGVFGYDTGEIRCTRELIGVTPEGVGWAAAVDWLIGAMEVVLAAVSAGRSSHGSLDPHRILVQYDGQVGIVGFGLPRLDLVDFQDDPTLLPITESLRYTAPESLEGAAEDASTDLFILGLIGTHLATGAALYPGTDAKTLLAVAADGEARKALEDVPETVAAWLGPMLEPWPEDRHAAPSTALEAAKACRSGLDGPSLAEMMEAKAEDASSVEIDLPRGWALPTSETLEAAEDPAVFEAAREARVVEAKALVAPLESALRDVDKALAKLAKPADWSDTPEAAERRDEARAHGDTARAGGRSAREVVSKLTTAADAAALDALIETLDEAVAQARGGAEEGTREATAALEMRQKALEEAKAQEAAAATATAHAEALDKARETLGTWAKQATELAEVEAPRPIHPDDGAVQRALEDFEEAMADVHNASTTLTEIELEEEDDPDAVLDATRLHIEAAQAGRKAAELALEALGKAEADATAAKAAAEAAAAEELAAHRGILTASGERVSAALARVTEAVEAARAEAEGFEAQVEAELAALTAKLEGLEARWSNWSALSSEEEGLEDAAHTGAAEADFAEADLTDLPALVEAFDGVLARAKLAHQVFEDERGARLKRLESADEALAAATEVHNQATAFQVPDDIDGVDTSDLESSTLALGKALATAPEVVREGMPEGVDEREAASSTAAELSTSVAASLASLREHIHDIRTERLAAEEARQTAIAHASKLQEALAALLVPHTAPKPTGDAEVDERLQADFDAVIKAIEAFPTPPDVDVEGDPVVAAGALEPALDSARQAAHRLEEAQNHLKTRTKAVRTLVKALAKSCKAAEAAADEAAQVSAQAREKAQDVSALPGLAKAGEALSLAIREVEAHAKSASEAASKAAASDDAAQAEEQAAEASKALAAARKSLKSVSTQSTRLGKQLSTHQEEQAAADETARQAAVGTARSLRGQAEQLQADLDAAIQSAVELLEETPSAAARAKWAAAESAIDATQAQLASMAELQDAVEKAGDRAQAETSLAALQGILEPAEAAVAAASKAAGEAAALARAETQANVALHESLAKEAAELGEHLRGIQTALEYGEVHAALKEVRQHIKALKVQLGHAQDAKATVGTGLQAVNDAADEAARQKIAVNLRAEMARLTAAKNTATALREKIDRAVLGAAEADAAEREQVITQARAAVETGRTVLERARERATTLEAYAEEEALDAVRVEASLQLDACETALAELVGLVNATEALESGAEAQKSWRSAKARLDAIDAADKEHVQAVQRVVAAHTDLLEQRASERKARVQARVEAIESVRDVHRRLCGGLGEAEAALAEADVDIDLEPDLEPLRQEIARLSLFLEGLPADIGPDGLETAQKVAQRARSEEEGVKLSLQSFHARLETAMAAASALAGIRGEAAAVRKRYQGLESQLEGTRMDLEAASEHAPTSAQSLGHKDAIEQLAELQTTLGEAHTSLDELNASSDAEEAKALLEVAEASLDIAGSLFEFVLPVVQAAVDAAEEEARQNRALTERSERAQEQIEAAVAGVPDAEVVGGRVSALTETLVDLDEVPGREPLDAALSTLSDAHTAWTALRDQLLENTNSLPEALEALETHASSQTSLRSTLDGAEAALFDAMSATETAAAEARTREADRQNALSSAREQHSAHQNALVLIQQEVAARLAAVSDTTPDPSNDTLAQTLDTLNAQGKRVADLQIPDLDATDLETVQARATAAAGVLDDARDPAFDAAVEAHEGAVAEARAAAEAQAARIEELRAALARDATLLKTGQQHAQTRLDQAVAAADPWPLETLEALDALQTATTAILALDSPPVPDLPEPARGEDLELLEASAETLTEALESLGGADIDGLAQAVLDAVEQAAVTAEAEAEALEAAKARIQAAHSALEARQAAAVQSSIELADVLAMPEIKELAEAYRAAVDQLAEVVLESPNVTERVAAEEAAARAESISKTPIPYEELAQAVLSAAEAARQDRADLRTRIQIETDTVTQRLGLARQHRGRFTGGHPRLDAALAALDEAITQLEALSVEINDDADVEALTEVLSDAELAAAGAGTVDVEGLAAEAEGAVQKAAAEAAEVEEQRASTQAEASEAVDAALLQLTMEVESRREAVDSFPDDAAGTASSHRSRARDALEAANSIMAHLEELQAKLQQPVAMTEAVSATFDAESQAEIARQRLDDVDAALSAATNEIDKMSRAREAAPRLVARIHDVAGSILRSLEDLPDAEGEDAETLRATLDGMHTTVSELTTEADACQAQLAKARTAFAADTEHQRLRALETAVLEHARNVRSQAADLRTAIDTARTVQASKRAEALAEGTQRAQLAVERADVAARAVSALLTAMQGTPEQDLLTRTAEANDRALRAVDTARAALEKVASAPDVAEEAVTAADDAEAALDEAKSILVLLTERDESRVKAEEASAQAALERVASDQEAARNRALPELEETLAELETQIQEADAAAAPPIDEDGTTARDSMLDAVAAAKGSLDTARGRLELLRSARSEDVEDFVLDVQNAVAAVKAITSTLEPVGRTLREARLQADDRGAQLQLAEARGRAWEACQLAQRLAKELTMARNALPALPEPTPPAFRAAADQLAEVERRLWRAGQRADEARERASAAIDLPTAVEAATAAETAVGSAKRWEKEIDQALDTLSTLLKGPGHTGVRDMEAESDPQSSRMKKLRRGRDAPAEDAQERLRKSRDSRPPFAPAPVAQESTSPTERLLQRLRSGRARGETGRERLKRLREQRKARQDSSPYPSVAEFDEHAGTVIDGPPPDDPTTAMPDEEADSIQKKAAQTHQRRTKRKSLLDDMRKRKEAASIAADEGRTQVFTREQLSSAADEDVATQMFTREMLEAHVDEMDQDEDTQPSPEEDPEIIDPETWAEDEGSTKYSMLSPSELALRKPKKPE